MKNLYKNKVRLGDYQGVNRLLARVINGVLFDEIDTDRAKVISTLCNTLLKSLEGDTDKIEQLARIEGINATTDRTIKSIGDDTSQDDKMSAHMEKLNEILDNTEVEE